MGNWLFKAEAAYLDGFMFFLTGQETFVRIDLLAGLEYYGFRNTTLSLDMVNRHLVDFDPGNLARMVILKLTITSLSGKQSGNWDSLS